jgi:creatinine amidohydrolase
MQWQELTADDFSSAVQETGVCIVPMGVLERHSSHLPLGTDVFLGHRVAVSAAEREPAIVFPPMIYGQIYEARCFPGTIAINPTLLIHLLQNTFDEIGRNGIRKIVIHNAHGGNWALLRLLAQMSLSQKSSYSLYVQTERITAARKDAYDAIFETSYHGHACEMETSAMIAAYPELVKMDRVPPNPADSLGRTAHLPGSFTGIWWYGNHPEHYAGDARTANAEKGRQVLELLADSLADFVRSVKNDQVVPALEQEFFERELSIRDHAPHPESKKEDA